MDFMLLANILFFLTILGPYHLTINEVIAWLRKLKCDHIWKCTGYWDGKDQKRNRIGGPKAQCTQCGESAYFHWKDWKALPEEKRIELNPWRNG